MGTLPRPLHQRLKVQRLITDERLAAGPREPSFEDVVLAAVVDARGAARAHEEGAARAEELVACGGRRSGWRLHTWRLLVLPSLVEVEAARARRVEVAAVARRR